ncbi:hypothetical protein [Microbacterium sp. SZ1]|uniref:hypothetical protein n=1 Tax=Microbacterium sp. SZ1 TaxID=1849736 RepID=UPI001180BC78|nr:hypothetical protein [Microbacterium sp. SZ1]
MRAGALPAPEMPGSIGDAESTAFAHVDVADREPAGVRHPDGLDTGQLSTTERHAEHGGWTSAKPACEPQAN